MMSYPLTTLFTPKEHAFRKKTQRDIREPLVLDLAFAMDIIPSTREHYHELAKTDELSSVNVSCSTLGGLLHA